MTCEHCERAATNYAYGGIQEGCDGCQIRGVAKLPKHMRQQEYAKWARELGEERMQEKRRSVVAEYQRIDGLREKANG